MKPNKNMFEKEKSMVINLKQGIKGDVDGNKLLFEDIEKNQS